MKKLPELLKAERYVRIPFKVSKTQHLYMNAQINGVKGLFILDTGASNSCIDFSGITYFNLHAEDSATTASGAGANGMSTKISEGNVLKLGRWKKNHFNLVVFDLSHVNQALLDYKTKPVHGIIGADVLLEGKAIIDYYDHNLYLKK
jgi:predicted aspartyl protease